MQCVCVLVWVCVCVCVLVCSHLHANVVIVLLALTCLHSNSNVTHAVILKPVVQGIYNISWGRITYTSEGSGDTLVRTCMPSLTERFPDCVTVLTACIIRSWHHCHHGVMVVTTV